MYYFKKISLLNRKLRLTKQIGKLQFKIEKYDSWHIRFFEDKIPFLETKIEMKEAEIEVIDENLEYLQREKPPIKNRISNNSVNVGAKNESGAHIQMPPIIEK